MTQPRDLDPANTADPQRAGTGIRGSSPSAADDTTSESAAQVAMAESELRRLGFEGVRVHPHGELARLQLPFSSLEAISVGLLRDEILQSVRSAGFRFAAIDLDEGERGTPD